jgi:hypothetical protein
MLVITLAAEFQGFARDLHDDGTSALLSGSEDGVPIPATLVAVVRPLLSSNRRIDRGNADPSALGEDFGRFGLSWWMALTALDPRTHLDRSTCNASLWLATESLTRTRANSIC